MITIYSLLQSLPPITNQCRINWH